MEDHYRSETTRGEGLQLIGQPPMWPPPLRIVAKPPPEKRKSPLERIPENKRHRYEKIVLSVRAFIEHEKDLMREWIMAPSGDRNAFEIPLTPEEQMTNYLDMQKRAQIINGIVARQGLQGVRDYLDHVAGQAENG